jgi:hypothetical protein
MPGAQSIEPDMPPFPRMRGVGADGFINIDVACRTCGYDLRALSADAKCPECGTDALGSLRSEQLYDADPNWVRQLSRGAQVIGLTLVVHMTLACLTRGLGGRRELMPRLIDVACMIPWLVGVWMLTRPDPSGRGEREYGRLRRAWWVSAIAVGIIDLVELMLALRFDQTHLVQVVQALAYAVTAFIGLQFLAKIGARLADDTIIRTARALSFSFALSYFILALLMGFDRIFVWAQAKMLAATCIGALLIIGFFISQVVYIGFLSRLSDRLRIQSLMGRDNDANEKAHGR